MSDTKPEVFMRDPMVHDLHTRVSRLEQAHHTSNTELAVMKTDLSYVKDNVGAIRSGINKILWAISLAVIAAATTFVLSGGLIPTIS